MSSDKEVSVCASIRARECPASEYRSPATIITSGYDFNLVYNVFPKRIS